jgi:hypothetical protein
MFSQLLALSFISSPQPYPLLIIWRHLTRDAELDNDRDGTLAKTSLDSQSMAILVRASRLASNVGQPEVILQSYKSSCQVLVNSVPVNMNSSFRVPDISGVDLGIQSVSATAMLGKAQGKRPGGTVH